MNEAIRSPFPARAMLICLVAVTAVCAAQDTIVVKNDGSKISGTIIEEDFDFVVLRTEAGEEIKINADDIKDIQYPDPDRTPDAQLEDAGGGAGQAAAREKRRKLTHEEEWPRDPETPLEEKVWALGPRIRWDQFEAAAVTLGAITDEGYVELFEELLLFEYTIYEPEEDDMASLWRTTLADSLGRSKTEPAKALARRLAKIDDDRKRHDAIKILSHIKTPGSAEIIHSIFRETMEPIPESQRPMVSDIFIANPEQFEEAMSDLDAVYDEEKGLAGVAEQALRDLGAVGMRGVGKGMRKCTGEKKRATIYLVARLTEIDLDARKKYGYKDTDVAEINNEAVKFLVPMLGKDREFLVDLFFAIVKIGEPTYPILIKLMKSQDQKRWAGVALRRMTGEKLPTSYQRWMGWYKARFGR